MTRIVRAHNKPASACYANKWPEMFTPEMVAQGLEILQEGVEQFRAELQEGPSAFPSEFQMQRTPAMDAIWRSNLEKRIAEWQEEAVAYQQLLEVQG